MLLFSLTFLLVRGGPPRYTAFHNGDVLLDTDGNVVMAHQPHIYGPLNGTFYLYGAEQVGASRGKAGVIRVYTSTDVYNWQYQGVAFDCSCSHASRASVLGFNNASGRWVMWMKGNATNATLLVATATSPLGPFASAGGCNPSASTTAGDSHAYLDPTTGAAYMVYSQQIHTAIMVVPLNAAWTAPEGEPHVAVAGHLEAPLPFYAPAAAAADRFLIWCSHTTGWAPNPAELLAGTSMAAGGGWRGVGNPSGSKNTYGSQGSHVLPLAVVNGTQRFLYMADRYEPFISGPEGSRYIFLPLEVRSDGKASLIWRQSWQLNMWP